MALVTVQQLLEQLEPGLLGDKLKPLQARLSELMEKNGLSSKDVARRVRIVHAGKPQRMPGHGVVGRSHRGSQFRLDAARRHLGLPDPGPHGQAGPGAVGGEIGEVGKRNSTPEELRAYMDGLLEELAKRTLQMTASELSLTCRRACSSPPSSSSI